MIQRPGGRTERTRLAVITAAQELLAVTPANELTVRQIADRAGVNESTIFRKWGTKDSLLGEVITDLAHDRLPSPDTGSLRGDLMAIIEAVAAFLRTPAGTALVEIAAVSDDQTTGDLRRQFWTARFAHSQAIFDRARARGEIKDASRSDAAYEMLIGALHFRILQLREPLPEDAAERLVDIVVSGVR